MSEPAADHFATVSAVQRLLRERGWSLAVAESLTAGLLTARLADLPGSSEVLRGGVVAYATDLKRSLLGVPGDLLARAGPVSAEVAGAMASGVADRLGANVGVAVTGVAGPARQGGADVGDVFAAVHTPGRMKVDRLQLTGDRGTIREKSVTAVIELLALELGECGQ